MNLKKFAIRGIVILAVFVALCMFFSGTVRTITTPKVRLTAAKRGKLEERVELACKPAFPEVEEIGFSLDDDASLTIVKVNTREGYTVQEGDSIHSIAEAHGLSTKDLCILNQTVIIETAKAHGLEFDEVTEYAKYLYPGEVLLVPNNNDQ